MHDYRIYHKLASGHPVIWRCMGRSMEPVYHDRELITIYPFNEQRPDPVVGDVVHFYTGHGFNRHQVADIYTEALSGYVWYRLAMGNGSHDTFVGREDIIGYVIPQRMADRDTEPSLEYGKHESEKYGDIR